MDAKLLATIIAVAKKEAATVSVDTSRLAATIESKLKEFHRKSPILDLPEFSIVNDSLQCNWESGLKLNLGNVIGPKGDSIKGDKGDSVTGLKGDKGVPGPSVKGLDGSDGVGIDKISISENHHLMFKMTSGKTVDAGYVRGAAGVNASKGGRVTGGYSGGSASALLSPKGVVTLDFGTGSKTSEVVVSGVPSITPNSIVMCALRLEETAEHSVDDLTVDPISVSIKDLVEGVGFTLQGIMFNARANGTYKVHWHSVQ